MQTGVSEGNVVTAREYEPCSARNHIAGVRASPTEASNIDGVSPSTTIRTSLRLVAGKRAQSGEPLRRASAQPCRQRRNDGRFEIADARNPSERGEHDRRDPEHDRGSNARAAAAQGPCDNARAANGAED